MQIDPSVWRTIPGFEKYEANPFGQVRNKKTQRILKPFNKNCGKRKPQYVLDLVSNNGTPKRVYVITAIAKTFLKIPDGKIPYHKGSSATDNSIWNISFGTKEEVASISGKKTTRKNVIQIFADGSEKYYRSIREASEKTFCSEPSIRDHCKNKYRKLISGQFTFAYEDDKWSIKKAKERIKNANGKKV